MATHHCRTGQDRKPVRGAGIFSTTIRSPSRRAAEFCGFAAVGAVKVWKLGLTEAGESENIHFKTVFSYPAEGYSSYPSVGILAVGFMIAVMMVPVPRVIVTIVIRAATGKHKKEEAGKSPKHCAEANEKLDV